VTSTERDAFSAALLEFLQAKADVAEARSMIRISDTKNRLAMN
jgi:hypothetical protein